MDSENKEEEEWILDPKTKFILDKVDAIIPHFVGVTPYQSKIILKKIKESLKFSFNLTQRL